MIDHGQKALDVLRIASLEIGPERRAAYHRACERWSENAVIAKFDSLVDSGLIECGASARTGWLTSFGQRALAVAERDEYVAELEGRGRQRDHAAARAKARTAA